MKSAYTRPRLVVYGKLKDITQETGTGGRLDANFSQGTELADLTFS